MPELVRIFRKIYIGEASLLYHQNLVEAERITAIVRLDDHELGNTADWPADRYEVLFAPFPDEQPVSIDKLDAITEWIKQQLGVSKVILVHCAAGRSRSVTVLMAYLMKHLNFTPHEARRYVENKYPRAAPATALLASLEAYERWLKEQR